MFSTAVSRRMFNSSAWCTATLRGWKVFLFCFGEKLYWFCTLLNSFGIRENSVSISESFKFKDIQPNKFWQLQRDLTCQVVQSWFQHVSEKEQNPPGSKSLPATSTEKGLQMKTLAIVDKIQFIRIADINTWRWKQRKDATCKRRESRCRREGERELLSLKALKNSETTRQRQCAEAAWCYSLSYNERCILSCCVGKHWTLKKDC